MLVSVLNDWRRALLQRGEILSHRDSWGLRVREGFGAPSFTRIDERRWCQASV